MARKALLIGAQTAGLTGVDNDITALSKALDQWDFTMTRCQAENASRAGILDAYERLVAEARPDDAIVVHYSGHGGRTHSSRIQFIVPTDYAASTPGDFRGITAAELSLLLADLTARTPNVTVILDCCHSAHLSRDPDQAVRAIGRAVPQHVLTTHLDTVRRTNPRLNSLNPQGNPHAVRIVACAPEQSAYERRNRAGVSMGLLTDALTTALCEARQGNRDIPWASIIDRLRHRVLTVEPRQRPEAEGPAQRILFDTREADPVATLPITVTAGIARIPGAPLLNAHPGDEFTVTPTDEPTPHLARVHLTRVDATTAWGPLTPPDADIPVGARAHLTRTAAPAFPVALPDNATLARAVDAAPLLRATDDGRADVAVEVDGAGGLVITDRYGPLRSARQADGDGVALVVRDLTRLARAHALRTLADRQLAALDTPLTVEFGLAGGRPLPSTGAVLYAGQPIYVRIRNDGNDTVYVSLMDIGVASAITLLTPASPGGQRLGAGEEFVFGRNEITGDVPGVALTWPTELPTATPRPESVLVLATSAPVDTRVLEQQGVRGLGSPLERVLAQLRTGQPRDLTPPTTGRPVRFAVHTIDFDLVPAPAPPPETTPFQVDDRPPPASVLWGRSPSAPVTVCLDALVVHHDRSVPGTELRLDTVIVTGEGTRTHTAWFTAVSDGQRLVPDDPVVYQGDPRGPLDIAVWVSPARGRPLDPPTTVDSAHERLCGEAGETVALYRTTVLPPETGAVTARARDFTLTYRVTTEERTDQ